MEIVSMSQKNYTQLHVVIYVLSTYSLKSYFPHDCRYFSLYFVYFLPVLRCITCSVLLFTVCIAVLHVNVKQHTLKSMKADPNHNPGYYTEFVGM